MNHKEGWVPKNWCFLTVVLEKTLESPSNCKEIKQGNLRRNPPWILIGRPDATAEDIVLGPPDVKSWLFTSGEELKRPLILGKVEGGRRMGWQRVRWLHHITEWTWIWANSGRQWRIGKPGMVQFMRSQRVRNELATEQPNNDPLERNL